MSRSALAQRFTDLIGQPPMQYLTRWRLTIAAHIGYESEAAFDRAFKREFAVTPAKWRREAHT